MRLRISSLLALLCAALGLTVVQSSPVAAATATPAQCASWVRLADVSSNNPHPIDWSKVARAGVAGVYIKNSEALNYVNQYWSADTSGATKAGVPWGGYYFAQPGKTTAQAAAQYFVAHGGAGGQLPPALDLEINVLSGAASTKWAYDFMTTVKALSGRTPIIYTGGFYPWSRSQALALWKLWVAAYPAGYTPVATACGLQLPYSGAWGINGWSIWQFTSVGRVNGLGGNVDISAADPKWWGMVTGAGVKPPKPGQNRFPAPVYAGASHGTKVATIQRLLVAQNLLTKADVDGVYGPKTSKAVFRWQQIIGAHPDGIWSSQTGRASDYWLKHHRPYPLPVNYPLLKMGDSGQSVRQLQSLLNKHHAKIVNDGHFGKATFNALVAFQRTSHLPPSGKTGPGTWKTLWK